jgi:hypothetical protein
MRVGVEQGPSWASARSSMLVKAEGYFTLPGGNPGRTYDVAADGQRFLMIKTGTDSDRGSSSPEITLVLNWIEELKQRVPTP